MELISLIVCTTGRLDPLSRLLASLKAQSDDTFELILVDQSGGSEVDECLRGYSAGCGVRYLRSNRGLSLGRNFGLQHAQGRVVGFPDDDCWYSDHVIAQVRNFFRCSKNSVLTGRTVDREGVESVSAHRGASGLIDRFNVFESGNSNTMFARMAVVKDVGGFDETLGVGAATPFQSGEETDFLLRCLRKGYHLYYDRDFVVHHDQTASSAAFRARRVRAYSPGYGRVLRIHGYGAGYISLRIARAAVRGAICLATGDKEGARYRYHWVSGSLRGFLSRVRPPEARH